MRAAESMQKRRWNISRSPGVAAGRSSGSAFGPLAWIVASAEDKTSDLVMQTRATFMKIDRILQEFGTARPHLLSVTVYLADLGQKSAFDALWREWVGGDPSGWPQRACIGATLSPGTLVEIAVTAGRPDWSGPA
jgi:enamine deaminase RidA (YjgF/YER057c/UK114 family)